MRKTLLLLMVLCTPLLLVACGDDEPSGGNGEKNITGVAVTGSVIELGAMYAQVDGVVNLDKLSSSYTADEMGVEYSTQSTFQEKIRVQSSGLTERTFSVRLGALRPDTKYYYHTYVYISSLANDYYGEIQSFTTKQMTEAEMCVDLALPSGTLWATVNVGASSPGEFGDYFAWGETTPKSVYDWTSYKWCQGANNNLTKYCITDSYGIVDIKGELDPEDDAAYVNMGPKWRMPSLTQIEELQSECNWDWTSMNGVNGYLITSKRSSASLFLPAAGYHSGGSLNFSGGLCWSRTLRTDRSNCAYRLYFSSGNVSLADQYRDYGLSVRAVRVP